MPLELWAGTRAPEGASVLAKVSHAGAALDFCLTSFAVPVARRQLGQAIAPIAGRDLQRLPIEISGCAGFEVLNSVRVIKCLDERLSKFTKWTEKDHRADLAGQYRMVTRLKIDLRLLPTSAHFFRLEGWRIALIVSERVKSAMENAGCLGAKFEDVT
jgi:hypothetical protein